MIKKLLLILLLFLTINLPLTALTTAIRHTKKTGSGVALLLKFNLEPHEFLLKDSLRFSTDAPNIVTSPWKTKQKAQSHYMSGTKNNKEIYGESFMVGLQLSKTGTTKKTSTAHLHISCFVSRNQKIIPYLKAIPLNKKAA